MPNERWETLTAEEQDGFAPLCPDFAVELRSPRDSVDALRRKMAEHLENGAALGWLVDPLDKCVYVFRPDETTERLDNPHRIEGGPTLPGFVLDLDEIWCRSPNSCSVPSH